jgi:Domain of unknown function (DUF1330)
LSSGEGQCLSWVDSIEKGSSVLGLVRHLSIYQTAFDIASIKNWHRAPEYRPLIALRRSAAADVMIIVEGM